MKHIIILLFFLGCMISTIRAQESVDNSDVIQFSGVVINGDNLEPVSYTSIIIKSTRRGTLSDYYGYFSFVALKKDTIEFSAVGYKKGAFIIPDTITQKRYSLIQLMSVDTILLEPTVIYPWPTEEDFKKAFVELDIPDDDLEIARKNLAKAEIRDRAENYKMDGSMNYKNYIQNETSKLYYFGQTQPISILNPFAWAQFIKAWKQGKFKQKKKVTY